jgi:hypothetical protein
MTIVQWNFEQTGNVTLKRVMTSAVEFWTNKQRNVEARDD